MSVCENFYKVCVKKNENQKIEKEKIACLKISLNSHDFAKNLMDVSYQNQLLEIVSNQKNFFRPGKSLAIKLQERNKKHEKKWHKIKFYFFEKISNIFLCFINHFLYQPYLPNTTEILCNLRLNKIPFIFSFSKSYLPQQKLNIALRHKLQNQIKTKKSNGLLSICSKLIFYTLPIHLLEGFADLEKQSEKKFRFLKPAKITTSIAHVYDDKFKVYLGKNRQYVKFQIISHGGYGISNFEYDEKYEVKLADKYFTWGWKSSKNSYPLGIQKIINKQIDSNPFGKGILLSSINPVVNFRLSAGPKGDQIIEDIHGHFKFFAGLSPCIKKQFDLRFSQYQNSYNYAKLWTQHFGMYAPKNIHTSTCLYKILHNYRIAVVTWNATVVRELLALKIPTIMIWNPRHYNLRKSALVVFDRLMQANIYFHDMSKASAFLNKTWPNVNEWWYSSTTQNAIQFFCNRLARPISADKVINAIK